VKEFTAGPVPTVIFIGSGRVFDESLRAMGSRSHSLIGFATARCRQFGQHPAVKNASALGFNYGTFAGLGSHRRAAGDLCPRCRQ